MAKEFKQDVDTEEYKVVCGTRRTKISEHRAELRSGGQAVSRKNQQLQVGWGRTLQLSGT